MLVPARRLSLGTPAHSLSPPLPSALDFQTESKMGSHQIRFVFFQCNFPFIDSLLAGGTVLPLSRFFSGCLGINSWWLFWSPVVSSPAGHSFRVSPESLHLRLRELMLISVASEPSMELCPCSQVLRNIWRGPAGSLYAGSSWWDDVDDNYSIIIAADPHRHSSKCWKGFPYSCEIRCCLDPLYRGEEISTQKEQSWLTRGCMGSSPADLWPSRPTTHLRPCDLTTPALVSSLGYTVWPPATGPLHMLSLCQDPRSLYSTANSPWTIFHISIVPYSRMSYSTFPDHMSH